MTYTINPNDYADFDALIFDMDGTLVDSGQLHEHAWTNTLSTYQLPIDRPLMRSLAGSPTHQTILTICQHFCVDAPANIDEITRHKENLARQHVTEFAKPTQLADIAHFFCKKKPMAVGTGALTSEAEYIIALCGLNEPIDVIVGADKVRHPKPSPDTFLLCAEKLNINPNNCLVFEDAPMGLKAAQDAGMHVVDVEKQLGIQNNYFL